MIRGTDHRKRNIIQGTRNEPPPFAPTILGNLQMFPVPIAAPIVAKISPSLPLNWSLDCFVSDVIASPHFPLPEGCVTDEDS